MGASPSEGSDGAGLFRPDGVAVQMRSAAVLKEKEIQQLFAHARTIRSKRLQIASTFGRYVPDGDRSMTLEANISKEPAQQIFSTHLMLSTFDCPSSCLPLPCAKRRRRCFPRSLRHCRPSRNCWEGLPLPTNAHMVSSLSAPAPHKP